jgi:hypothetical protein
LKRAGERGYTYETDNGSVRFRTASSEQLDGVLNFIRDSGGHTTDVQGRSETLEDVFVRSVRSDGR